MKGPSGLLAQRLLALLAAGVALFNFPLLKLALPEGATTPGPSAGPAATWLGWPPLALALFALWALLIVLLAVLMERGGGD